MPVSTGRARNLELRKWRSLQGCERRAKAGLTATEALV